ncbi:MAG: cellulase family glycosylhydrolase [Anaerolineales bacterium]|nr:cellulase family glycosylhydrolase [Anaerolineales bacterium]
MMSLNKSITVVVLFLYALAACQTTPPTTTPPTATPDTVAAIPTATSTTTAPTPATATCADLDANWGNNWPAVLDALTQLIAADQSCGEEPLLSKKYAAHYIYGVGLEEKGEVDTAIVQFRAALAIDPQRKEALDALFRLKALPKPTPPACLVTSAPRPDPAPAEAPDPSLFVTVKGDQLQLDGQPFQVKGVNYYPRRAPWQRFISEANPTDMAEELDLIKQAGFNTLRVFLWNEPLFTCQPEDAIPNETAFATLDNLFGLAGERSLKLIVTLNDLPDLTFRPLYTDYAHYDNQTIYIVRRYRNEPSLLAWDLRNEGDINHGAQSAEDARFTQQEVMDWLAHISPIVRENDPHHLITAGWWGDPLPTEPYVDFLSFHHWTEANELQKRINQYRQASAKPLLLEEVGYHSWTDDPAASRAEQEQADTLEHVIRVAEAQKLSGWVIWTAFDFVPAAGQPPNEEHFFGLWRTDLTPKPALEALPLP